MTLISDTAMLAAFCQRRGEATTIAVDTEFMRDSSYWPKLCLVQLGWPEEVVAVDCLAPGIDLAPLLALMADTTLLKVFHSARQDLEIFYHLTGAVPEPIFDTQVAAMVCGFGDSAGYETLAKQLAGANIDKASRFSDWARRPLPKRQLDYALSDVIHLRQVYRELARRLEKNGRVQWLSEEMAVLANPKTYDLDPAKAWRRLKTRSSDRRYLAILHELAAWREIEAQHRDVPRNRIMRDEQLFDIAARAPHTAEELAHTRGMGKGYAQGRAGKGILKAIEAGQALGEPELPTPAIKPKPSAGLGATVDLFKVLLKIKCDQHKVAQKLVANSHDLEQIAADDAAPVRGLQGWRYEIFGADALALKHGKLALGLDRKKPRLVSLE